MIPVPRSVLPVLALIAAACSTEVAEETAELASAGGEILLRDTLREPTGPPRVLVFGLDGVGEGVLRHALEDGALPSLAPVAGAPVTTSASAPDGTLELPHAHLASVLTVLPSITLAAWTTLFTGEPPARTGVPGNEWFDRRIDRFRAPAPVSVSEKSQVLETLTDGLLGDWVPVPTLFERADVRSHVSMLHLHRGADVLGVPSAEDFANLMGGFAAGMVEDETVDREVFAEVDRASADAAVSALEEHGVPDLQVVYFPGVDLFTHRAQAPMVDQRAYLEEVLDPAMGAVLDAYRRAGALDDTWVIVTADHGHTPVPPREPNAVSLDAPRSPASLLDSLGWRVRPGSLDVDDGDHQAVVAYQGAFAFVYLADRSTCAAEGEACDWSRPPDPADVDSVAAALARRSSGVEAVLVPERSGDGSLTAVRRWREGARGPLSPPAADTALPALEERLGWLLDGPEGVLAGDLVVMAASGAWVPEEERFYFSHRYRSWHGSAHPSDSRAPLLVARSDRSASEVRSAVRAALGDDPTQLGFVDLVLSLLEAERD